MLKFFFLSISMKAEQIEKYMPIKQGTSIKVAQNVAGTRTLGKEKKKSVWKQKTALTCLPPVD